MQRKLNYRLSNGYVSIMELGREEITGRGSWSVGEHFAGLHQELRLGELLLLVMLWLLSNDVVASARAKLARKW